MSNKEKLKFEKSIKVFSKITDKVIALECEKRELDRKISRLLNLQDRIHSYQRGYLKSLKKELKVSKQSVDVFKEYSEEEVEPWLTGNLNYKEYSK